MEPDFPRGRGAGGGGDTLTTLVDVVRGDGPQPPTGDARLIGRRLEDRYEILRPLDRGGMATVYVGFDHRLDREVAVKVMHPSLAHDPAFVARFRREAKAAASIRHRNVVAVTDAGADRDVVFLVMELVRGRTLRALLTERGRLPAGQALEVTESMLAALDAAHAAGLMHRDVKPENVLLGDDGAIEVADFGLARAVQASALTTHAGLLMGTVAYVAPEQIAHGTADARSDVYAAGIVLFEMLTGRVPYEAETPVAVAYRHVHEQVPAPSTVAASIPAGLDELVANATARDPADRFADAGAFLAAVRRARRDPALRTQGGSHGRDTVAIAAPPGTQRTAVLERPEPETDRVRRRRWPWVLALLLVLSAGAGVGGWWLARDVRTHVPALTDRSLVGYESALSARHLTWTVGASAHSDTVASGQVLTTIPAPGTAVKPHASIVIQPSAGVLQLTVPTLAGTSQATASAALAKAGLPAPTATTTYSDTTPTGWVISSIPAADAVVDHRTHVALTVSSGPAPVAIPDEAGQTEADAERTLASLGLQAAVAQAFSDTVPAGTVIAATPHGGSGHRGDSVTLTVSKGPQLVAVPDVTGENGTQAAADLRAAGLVPREVALFGIHGGQVVTQSPRGGKVKPGSTVTYYTAY